MRNQWYIHLLTTALHIMVYLKHIPIDCETAIMHRLQSVIVEYTESLLTVVECSAELDWYMHIYVHVYVHIHLLTYSLISLAYLAKESNYTKPDLTEDNAIYIKAGRYVHLRI